MRVRHILAAALALSLPAAAAAQEASRPPDTTAEVPALSAMHEVVMPLWHEAWPARDTRSMAELLPAIEEHVAGLRAARLPGILRDKQAAWEAGLKEIEASASAYRAAVARKDEEALLKAAESLHAGYERLVRVVRPATAEIEAFHQVLYVLYHYDMEEFGLAAVRERVRALQSRMEALRAAALPARYASRKSAYEPARDRLAGSVASLAAAAAGGDQSRIEAAVADVHASYEALDAVFE